MLYIIKFKRIFQNVFLFHIEKILFYSFKLKYLKNIYFYSTLKKHNFFSYEHRAYILNGFKFHFKKIKYSSSIYIVTFEMG
jgi:hypothetical protein